MKSIKKLKKYGTAVAGTALLVGATLTGAAAQTSGSSGTMLGDYPAPFVDDDGTIQSSIVVGEDAATADVVGAIDIAGSLSQAAYTSSPVEGGDATTVNGATVSEGIRGSFDTSNMDTTVDASDYDGFLRTTITDSEDQDHFVTESATLDVSEVGTDVNNTDVLGTANADAVTYKANFAPGFDTGETLEMLGNEFEVTAVTQSDNSKNQVELGSTVTQSELGLDETYEHGPYTVKVEDFNQDQSTVLVQISKDGESLTMEGVGTSGQVSVDNGNFVVNADSIYFGSQDNYITLSSTYTDTVLTQGKAFPMDEDYTVSSLTGNNFTNGEDSGRIDSISLQNDIKTASNYQDTSTEDDVARLNPGDAVAGPADYFSLTYQGLTDESTTSVQVSDGHEVTYTDSEGFEHTVDLGAVNDFSGATSGGLDVSTLSDGDSGAVDVEGHPVTVTVDDASSSEVTLSYETYSTTLQSGDSVVESTGYGFEMNASLTGSTLEVNNSDIMFDTQFNKTFSVNGNYNSAVAATLDQDEDGTADLYVSYDGDVNTDDAAVQNVTTTGAMSDITSEDTDSRTDYGTTVMVGDDKANVDLSVPENQLMAEMALGEVTSSGSGDGMSMEPTYGDTFPSLGAVDTDESIGQVKENDNVILVGGPAINELTAELATENQTWDANEWRTGGHEGTSILQLTEGFDGEGGNKALVVAGHAAEDTRTAAEFLSNYGDHSEALSGQDQVTISTETGSVVQ